MLTLKKNHAVHSRYGFLKKNCQNPSEIMSMDILEGAIKEVRVFEGTFLLTIVCRAFYMGELRNNMTSSGTITKKPGFS